MREHREKISSAGADGLIAKPILGIEDFGSDIINYHEKSSRLSPSQPVNLNRHIPNSKHETLVDEVIYTALEKSIGSETMVELPRLV